MLGNEFARVRLRLDDQGHDPRLEILDLATDQRILLDSIMLANLVRHLESTIGPAMDPGSQADNELNAAD
jgi:hypothetical protein